MREGEIHQCNSNAISGPSTVFVQKKCVAQLFIYNYLTEVIRSQVREVFWEGGCESKYWKTNQAELGCMHSDSGAIENL